MTARNKRLSASAHRALAASVAVALALFALQPSGAAEPDPVKIAVFDFELDDRSAGRGIIEQDAADTENLKLSTEQARRMLSDSGRYSIVDAGSAAPEVMAAGGVQHCNGCEGPLAKTLGADQAMVGVFTRVSRTEYNPSDSRQGHADRRRRVQRFHGSQNGGELFLASWRQMADEQQDPISAARGVKVCKGSGLP